MHSGIVAYAMDIPKVGLIWSEKIDFLAKIIKERDTYFAEDELDAAKTAKLLIEKRSSVVDGSVRDKLKKKTLKYIGEFLDDVKEMKNA
jgi:polysaccharide pyruvyl transferase WcaK-like protein